MGAVIERQRQVQNRMGAAREAVPGPEQSDEIRMGERNKKGDKL